MPVTWTPYGWETDVSDSSSLTFGVGVNSDAGLTGSIVLNERVFANTEHYDRRIDDLPDVRLLATYDINGIGSDFDESQSDNAFRKLASGRYPDWTFGLQGNIPIGFRDTEPDARKRLANLNKFKRQVEEEGDFRFSFSSGSAAHNWRIQQVGIEAVLHQRLRYSRDPRLFTDLLAYAPGMNTSEADILAVTEGGGDAGFASKLPCRIDPAARKLIGRHSQTRLAKTDAPEAAISSRSA